MKYVILFFTISLFSCTQNTKNENSEKQTAVLKEIPKIDSLITLEIKTKPGEQFFFEYMDPLFNFNIIETPEKLKVDSIFKKEIVSSRPILIKDIHWMAHSYIYLKPGETYRITKDSVFSNFEVVGNPKRTYELNALKELARHIKKQKRITEFDLKDIPRYRKFTKMDFKARDSVLKNDYEDNLQFLAAYTSKNDFDPDQKKILLRNLLYQYKIAHLNFNKKTSDQTRKYLNDSKSLFNELLPMMNCDSCFDDPNFPYLTEAFAKNFIADPAKVGAEKAYGSYAENFKGRTRDYLLYNLIKLGGMFNSTKPNPKLARQFQIDARDPLLKSYIKETYDFLEIKKSATGKLANAVGEDISWSRMLENNKGKVVYVDFWASWCGPCRAEMPASKALKKRFKTKDVVFINISMDENSAAWKKACKSEGIDAPGNYILVQPDKSDLKRQFRITSIPRYFLIDKSGKVVNPNAPRPSDSKITTEIEQLL
ncbi:TlpA disulfide reductase family protein [Dyadobacter sp. CY312]|uniref:TlpA family protein disulfide reductase n=1 Tax=Dyadobacter sp. CY312 TaxID=2907303 RepID=UPI001F172416|nr:TlpA disulfide reductase family protein [Dyadobacter sp. CY312]MCE7042390.1 TlpA family protein disulfide reductase [Dyadobacter sp. CY312]